MPAHDVLITVIREWLAKADSDLKTATHSLILGVEAPTETICFHTQQCIEKYLKALLVYLAIPFPKTHNLAMLLQLIPAKSRPVLDDRACDTLTEYATVIRYPHGGPDISVAEARKAVAISRRIRREVRRLLPKASLRRKPRRG